MKSSYYKGIILVAFGAICFSTKGILAKLAFQYGVNGSQILTLRMLFSLPFYLFILSRLNNKQKIHIEKNTFLNIVFLGIIGYYLAALFDFIGLQYISANLERVIIFTYPTFVLILAYIFYKRKVMPIQFLAICVSYIGIAIALLSDARDFNKPNFFQGVIMVLLSALTYAFYLIKSDDLIKKTGATLFTCLSMIVSCIAVLLQNSIQYHLDIFHFRWQVYCLGVCIAIISTVLPSFLMTEGIKRIGSSNMAIVASLGPVATLFLSYFILNEKITIGHIIGTIFVLIGILALSLLGNKKNEITS